ncbi:MAG: ATP-binding cassette domain-containing protein [Thermodesulfobacteriota bacterium]
MLEVRDLSSRAGSFVLSNVSLSVHPSSCHVILGPTGSGKTLLLESVIGLRKPDRGKVFVNGDEITLLPMEKRRLSYVPQDLALFPHMTVRENILYARRIKGMRLTTENGVAKELIGSLGIEHLLDRRIRNLSGGERQRTALARAIVSGCKYLVLDEPLSALHESLKRELWYLMKDLQGRYELAILMVTHDLEEAFFLGDAISIIISGRVHQQGTKREIYGYPQSLEVAKFLGVGNLFRSRVTQTSGGALSVRCEDLGVSLNVSADRMKSQITQDNECIVGIRSEDIDILPPAELPPDGTNTVAGAVRSIVETGASFTIIATVGAGSKTVEITVGRAITNRLNLAIGQPILINLPAEHLFLIDPNSRDTLS